MSESTVQIDSKGRVQVRDPAGGIRVLAPAGLRNISDVTAATTACLQSPSDFVPLQDAVIEGDHVAIAADSDVPRLAEIIRATLDALPLARLGKVVVVLPEWAPPAIRRSVEAVVGETAKTIIHQPDVQEELAYLAADADGEPIYMNRALVEADFVLPIVVGRPTGTLRAAFTLGGVYPTFSGRSSIRRDMQQRIVETGRQAERLADKEAEEATWLLGLMMVLAVVPGERGKVAGVFAGTASGLQRDARPLLEAGWRRSPHINSPLVLVSLQSDGTPVPYASVCDGLSAALSLVDPDGALVMVLQDVVLDDLAFDVLASDLAYEEVLQRLVQLGTEPARLALLLAIAREQCRVYLYGSKVPRDRLESMGIFPIDAAELERIVSRNPHPVVMNDGQYCVSGPEGD